jgi:hypothetical protein
MLRFYCLCQLSEHVVTRTQNGLVPLRTSFSASPLYHSNQRGYSSTSNLVGGPGASRWSVTATASNGNLLQQQHGRSSLRPPRTADNNSSAGGHGSAVLHRHMHMHTRMRSAPAGSGASNSSSGASALSPHAVSVGGGGAASSSSEVLDVSSSEHEGVTCLVAAPESWSLDGLSDPTGCPLLTVAAEEVTTLAELTQRCWVSTYFCLS